MLLSGIAATVISNVASIGIDAVTSLFKDTTDAAADKMADIVEGATGLDLRDKDAVEAMTPEDRLKLNEAVMAHKEKLESIKLEHHRLANQDRADARDTEREILESPNAPMKTKLFRQRFALFITICCFAYVTAVTFIPAAFEVELNQRVVDILTGCMISKLNTIVEYYFGGSYGEVDHMSTTQVGQYQPNTQLTYRY